MNDTMKLIQNRKSTRQFLDKDIPQKLKTDIIQTAMRSPTAGNMMLYSILEIDEQGLKDKLAISCDNQPFIATSPFVLIFLADYQRWMDYFRYSDIETYCKENSKALRLPGEGDLLLAANDAIIAAQTAVIAAESVGIGSCYIGDIMENYEYHKDLLNLPKYAIPVTMLVFGYPTQQAVNRATTKRFSQEFIHFKNSYKQLSKDDFDVMYSERDTKNYRRGTSNFGQHFYEKKFASDFSREMTRSMKAAVASWNEAKKI